MPRKFFKLFVKDSGKPSIEILQYINKNIKTINAMGVVIKITKIEEETLDESLRKQLAKNGIKHFPTLVCSREVIKSGCRNIITMFESNMNRLKQQPGNSAAVGPFEDSDLAAYYAEQIDPRNIKQEKEEEEMGEGTKKEDFAKKMSDMAARRAARDRQSKNRPPPSDIAAPQAEDYEDNIGPAAKETDEDLAERVFMENAGL